MSHLIADAIRAHIGDPQSVAERALLAVLDTCEEIRMPAGVSTTGRAAAAYRIETAIARALGIEVPS